MSNKKVSIIREPDDPIAESRISLGTPRDFDGLYIVFRGQPSDAITLLNDALIIAKEALPSGNYTDNSNE